MHTINDIFTVDADLLMPILQWTRTFEPAFLNKKSKKKTLIDDWIKYFDSLDFRFQSTPCGTKTLAHNALTNQRKHEQIENQSQLSFMRVFPHLEFEGFPRSTLVSCFPALGTASTFSRTNHHLDLIGFLHYLCLLRLVKLYFMYFGFD